MRSFLQYYHRLLITAWHCGASWGRDQLVGFILAIAVFAVQVQQGLIGADQVDATWKTVLWPYILLFTIFVSVQLLRAPFKLSQEQEEETDKALEEVRELKARLDSIVALKPDIRGTVDLEVLRREVADQSVFIRIRWSAANYGTKECEISAIRVVIMRQGNTLEDLAVFLDETTASVVHPERQYRKSCVLWPRLPASEFARKQEGFQVSLVDSTDQEYPLDIRGLVIDVEGSQADPEYVPF